MYDLILRGGRIIDPGQDLDAVTDIAFKDGTVAALGDDVGDAAGEIVDCRGHLVVPGLIDLHTHVWYGGIYIGVWPDPVARKSGTTTLVDAGSAGSGNFHGLRDHIIVPAESRVLAFLNVSFAGIFGLGPDRTYGECEDLRLINIPHCLEVARANREHIIGVKIRVGASTTGNLGTGPLDIALDIAQELGLPLMTHVGAPPPSLGDILRKLRPGDILTHCYRPFPNAPILDGNLVRPEVLDARERGVIFDVGHGSGSFSFDTTRRMFDQGFLPDVISSDVHCLSEPGPAFDNLVTMSKLLSMGMPLTDVIRAATATPASVIYRPDLGSLKPGSTGDAAILEQVEGWFDYHDVTGAQITGSQRLELRGIVLHGRSWEHEDRDIDIAPR